MPNLNIPVDDQEDHDGISKQPVKRASELDIGDLGRSLTLADDMGDADAEAEGDDGEHGPLLEDGGESEEEAEEERLAPRKRQKTVSPVTQRKTRLRGYYNQGRYFEMPTSSVVMNLACSRSGTRVPVSVVWFSAVAAFYQFSEGTVNEDNYNISCDRLKVNYIFPLLYLTSPYRLCSYHRRSAPTCCSTSPPLPLSWRRARLSLQSPSTGRWSRALSTASLYTGNNPVLRFFFVHLTHNFSCE